MGGTSENKTVPTGASVEEFLDGVVPEVRRTDARVLLEIFTRLAAMDLAVLEELVVRSIAHVRGELSTG